MEISDSCGTQMGNASPNRGQEFVQVFIYLCVVELQDGEGGIESAARQTNEQRSERIKVVKGRLSGDHRADQARKLGNYRAHQDRNPIRRHLGARPNLCWSMRPV